MNQNQKKDMKHSVSVSLNPETTPIFYTDTIHMTTNPDGVILDVLQRLGQSNQARVVTRIGMSREHAKKFVKELGRLLAMTDGQVKTGEKEN